MGTRHITAIKKDGQFKVSQYGQWDGYPIGQWVILLSILKEIDLSILKEKVDMVRKITETELDAIPEEGLNEAYPWLSRDCWANIVKYIMEDKLVLNIDTIDLEPNIWIEWSYLIDFDNNTLWVYRGTILSKDKKPNKPMHIYQLNSLPTLEEWKEKYKDM